MKKLKIALILYSVLVLSCEKENDDVTNKNLFSFRTVNYDINYGFMTGEADDFEIFLTNNEDWNNKDNWEYFVSVRLTAPIREGISQYGSSGEYFGTVSTAEGNYILTELDVRIEQLNENTYELYMNNRTEEDYRVRGYYKGVIVEVE